MELKHLIDHEHPLIFNEEWGDDHHKACCSRCGEVLSGASFNCVACGFHLHKRCAEAPVELNHPFHLKHNLTLFQQNPYSDECLCNFCGKTCEHFLYHCSCHIDLHIKCALFTYNLAEKRMGELQHIACIDPLVCTKNYDEQLLKAHCFICWKPLLDCVYLSPECGFFLHVKCVDLSIEINHPVHPQHQLFLQFNSRYYFTCKICPARFGRGLSYYCSLCEVCLHIDCVPMPTQIKPFYHQQHSLSLQHVDEPFPCLVCPKIEPTKAVYFCSTCKVVVHVDCVSLPLMIEDKTHHEHPFILVHGQISFICKACGIFGNYFPYICCACGLIVHKKCISLPRVLKHPMHPEHPISHTYSLEKDKFDSWECMICHLNNVNPEHGSYFCSKCKYIVHVNCAIDEQYEIENATEDEEYLPLLSYSVINEIKEGENVLAIEIKHFSHQHSLLLCNNPKSKGDICCDGCSQFIYTSYYYCSSQCNFFLHKHCAELPKKKRLWFHRHADSHPLSSKGIFRCDKCDYLNSGFHYACKICFLTYFCVRCALVSNIARCEGHKHSLPFYPKFEGTCNACGGYVINPYRCKRCNFNLHDRCLKLPLAVQHKSDEHLLKLTYGDNNVYSEYNYCDICEEERNPNHWFYHCATCDNSAHVDCVLNRSNSFIKLGSTYRTKPWQRVQHEHDLTFVQMAHIYSNCAECGELCLSVTLECKEVGCNYIAHLECVRLW